MTNSAVTEMLDEAERGRGEGDRGLAMASAGLDPVLWADLAAMMQQMGNADQVGTLVEEAYASLARRLLVRAWLDDAPLPGEEDAA